MIRSLEGSPARPGLGHQSALGRFELRCGSSGCKDTWCPSGPWLESDLEGGGESTPSMSSLSRNSWHTPATRGSKVMYQKEPGAHRTRMRSNNGTHQQWRYLGLASGGLRSPPAICMPRSSLTTLYSILWCLKCSVWTCLHRWGEHGAISNSSNSSLLRQTPSKRRQIPLMVTESYSNLEEDHLLGLWQRCCCSCLHKEEPGSVVKVMNYYADEQF